MRHSEQPPVYAQVAYDIAVKISAGEIAQGERFTGRSLMGSQYRVSSETIRRAMRLLYDMQIISVQPNVGATVCSRQRAVEYVEQYKADKDLRALKVHLRQLIAQRDRLNEEITDTFRRITDLEERFQRSDQLRTYEFTLEADSPAVGQSIGQLSFRQQTGATIAAIRREGSAWLSPGPDTVLAAGDVLVVACGVTDISRVSQLIAPPAPTPSP